MKRPFVAVVSCYAIGLLLAGILRPPLVVLFGIAFAVLILACRAEASARRPVLDFIAGFDYENEDASTRTLDFGLRALDFNLSSDVADAQIIRFPG
jgi:hypothetical protein